MAGEVKLGLGITVLHILWTFITLAAFVSPLKYEHGDVLLWVCILTYSLYLFINVFLFIRLPKSDLLFIKLWFTATAIVFLFRVYSTGIYQISICDMLINCYTFVSMPIMAMVYFKIKKNIKLTINQTRNNTELGTIHRPPVQRSGRKYHRSPDLYPNVDTILDEFEPSAPYMSTYELNENQSFTYDNAAKGKNDFGNSGRGGGDYGGCDTDGSSED